MILKNVRSSLKPDKSPVSNFEQKDENDSSIVTQKVKATATLLAMKTSAALVHRLTVDRSMILVNFLPVWFLSVHFYPNF